MMEGDKACFRKSTLLRHDARLKGKARVWYRASSVCAEQSDVHQPSCAQPQYAAIESMPVTPLSQPTSGFALETWGDFARKFAHCCSHSTQTSQARDLSVLSFPPSLYPLSSEPAWWTSIRHSSIVKHTKMLLTLQNKMANQSLNSLTLPVHFQPICDFLSLSLCAEWGDFAFQMSF